LLAVRLYFNPSSSTINASVPSVSVAFRSTVKTSVASKSGGAAAVEEAVSTPELAGSSSKGFEVSVSEGWGVVAICAERVKRKSGVRMGKEKKGRTSGSTFSRG
jgi:hypothetical protein